MTYREYLASDEWKRKRDRRIQIDGKCQICGRPFDLNVHHMTYENYPNEKMTDLITVCRNCHSQIENMKNRPDSVSFHIVAKLLARQFAKENEQKDYSKGGNVDFCKVDVIKKYLFPYQIAHGLSADHVSGTNEVQAYFRNRRYEIILQYLADGADYSAIRYETKFSGSMIRKVINEEDIARWLLEVEKGKS